MNRRKKVKRLGAKTISFPKGKGHLTHNNREFISNNVVPERTAWNRIYIQESLEQAYEKCFGQALTPFFCIPKTVAAAISPDKTGSSE